MAAPSDEVGEPLCCCEYRNVNGEKSHVLAFLCDCQVVDETCDRFLKCQPIPEKNYKLIQAVVCDRLRIPSCLGGGAKRIDELVDTSAILPVIVVPVALFCASWNLYTTLVILFLLPLGALLHYRLVSRLKRRTMFFYSFGLVSVFFMGGVFYLCLVPMGTLDDSEIVLATVLATLMFMSFIVSKRTPGKLQRQNHGNNRQPTSPSSNQVQCKGSGNEQMYTNDDCRGHQLWCEFCQLWRPPRAGHCKVCQHCVHRLDHHCVWIDSCIGAHNHRSFILSLVFIIITGCYGIYLGVRSLCTYPLYIFTVECDNTAYRTRRTGLIYASCLYTSLTLLGFMMLLIQQLYLISHGITYREYRFQDHTHYSKNYLRNWINFIFNREKRHLEIV
ncbi:palmitoyltransferase ZDHHC23-like [Saccoglossus kowalevskii]|uniref:Palmitoyltransferase n=1 Tax=Saccoglossus kowalevskii TaxID=10224 RepID=A0ABM0LZ52_SACKO|nr:PREDICTED: palmitoyltransferase ZDHHC23-like [Saccoglossus kowalevskii]